MAEHSAVKGGQRGGMPGRPIGAVRVDIARQEHKTCEAILKPRTSRFSS